MMFYCFCVFIIVFYSYLIGSFNFSILISNLFFKKEIRTLGSCNAGTTNMLRNFGKLAAIFTFLFDFLKGFVSVSFVDVLFRFLLKYDGYHFFEYHKDKAMFLNFQMWAFVAVVVGHIFPLFHKFKGGKGIATSAGAMLAVNSEIFLVTILFFLAVFLIFRIVSISSVCTFVVFTLVGSFYWFYSLSVSFSGFRLSSWTFIVVKLIFLSCLITYKHKSNIIRFLNGKEPKIGR